MRTLVLVLSATACGPDAEPTDDDPCAPRALADEAAVPAPLADALRATLADTRTRLDVPAATLAVRLPDGRTWTGADGIADVATGARVDVGDSFGIGSITKMLVATLVVQEVRAGTFDLGDPVERWYPDLPGAPGITIDMLLRHTSGLVDYTDMAMFREVLLSASDQGFPIDETVRMAGDEGLRFDPGTAWAYSNTNYFVLGRILERETGTPVETLIRERLGEPLGLTSFHMMGLETADACSPLTPGHLFGQPDFDIDPRWAWASGGIAGSVRDLTRWGVAFFEGDAVSPDDLDAMTRRTDAPRLDGSGPAPYGAGVYLRSTPCGTVQGHTGSTMGYQSDLFRRDDGLMVAVLGNDFLPEISDLAYAACATVDAWSD